MTQKIIAVFGSARSQPGSPSYDDSFAVGAALAEAGYIVMTGGYAGVMEAASKGAAQAGGIVHGITVEKLEAIGESRVNEWVTEEIRYPDLRKRLDHLIDTAAAYVVMPGGVGTLQEFVEVWQLVRLGDLARRPILIYGEFWKPLMTQILDSAFISDYDMQFVQQVNGPEELTAHLAQWFEEQER